MLPAGAAEGTGRTPVGSTTSRTNDLVWVWFSDQDPNFDANLDSRASLNNLPVVNVGLEQKCYVAECKPRSVFCELRKRERKLEHSGVSK